jgi:two-component system osmolarity sensor histidine kinase EnvZ
MFFRWLKRYLPRGLYSRAALILILPVVTLQLVVSIVFMQRHFEGVTRQMSQTVAREVHMLLADLPPELTGADITAHLRPLSDPLEITVFPPGTMPPAPMGQRRWYDVTGLYVQSSLWASLPELAGISLPDDYDALLFVDTPQGQIVLQLARARLSASNAHQLFVHMVFFGGLMTLIAFIYLRNQLRPITRLARAAEAFGKGRTLPYRPTGATEVRAAGNAFLDMRARIERQIEQRTQMLSGVSHDMRTPLTRLRLGLSMLEEDDAQDLLHDVDDMQRMLDEFLAFSAGAAEGDPEPTDPVQLVRGVVEDARRANQDVTLVQASGQGGGQGTVQLNPTAMRRALSNLVENGVRYGGRVQVSVTLTDKSLRIRVEDNGPGIPPEKRETALKAFTRLDSARNQNRGGGVGLGLAIATDIARAHGGVLRLGSSEALGGLQADIVIAR